MPAAIMQSNNNDEHDIVVANQTQGGSSYTARLMDDEAIQSLRRDLREYEVNIARHGHLQEYVASKPVQVSRIELLQSTSSGNTYDPPTTPSTLGTPRQTSRRQHPSSVIRHRDSFATAMVKHHLGFDPLMKTDDDIENQDITPIAAPATTGDTLLLPCRPALDERCATQLVSLELLSLSHNKLQSLEHFQHLVNLVEGVDDAHNAAHDYSQTSELRSTSPDAASVDMYKAAASDSAVTSLVDEITRLRIENNNIPILQAEIHQLKATIRHSPPNYDDDDNQQPGTINDSSKSVKALQAENAALTRQVNKLRTMLAARQATDDNHGPVKQSKEE
ncbi:hypothetical protein DYB38_011781, partial [Aphanomyces astaci]